MMLSPTRPIQTKTKAARLPRHLSRPASQRAHLCAPLECVDLRNILSRCHLQLWWLSISWLMIAARTSNSTGSADSLQKLAAAAAAAAQKGAPSRK